MGFRSSIPHKERTFDKERPRTTLAEIIDRYERPNPIQDVEDKNGIGFTVVIQKT